MYPENFWTSFIKRTKFNYVCHNIILHLLYLWGGLWDDPLKPSKTSYQPKNSIRAVLQLHICCQKKWMK